MKVVPIVTPALARAIAGQISRCCATVLRQRGIADADLARELGANAAQGVTFLLHRTLDTPHHNPNQKTTTRTP